MRVVRISTILEMSLELNSCCGSHGGRAHGHAIDQKKEQPTCSPLPLLP